MHALCIADEVGGQALNVASLASAVFGKAGLPSLPDLNRKTFCDGVSSWFLLLVAALVGYAAADVLSEGGAFSKCLHHWLDPNITSMVTHAAAV